MNGWILLGLLAIVSVSVHAQSTMRIRGTITDFDGSVLSVKSRDGKDLKLADNATVVVAKAITLNDLKPGDYVGSTTRTAHPGQPTGCEVAMTQRCLTRKLKVAITAFAGAITRYSHSRKLTAP